MSKFTIFPAIDMKDGRCVRLRQGKADEVTVYADDPLAMAKQWAEQGGEYLHLVDLDGAFAGEPVNHEVVMKIAQELGIPVEIGGGLRNAEQIKRYLDAGVDRVIIGTKACDPEFLSGLVKEFGKGIAVGIDARDGFVQVKGWVETTELKAIDLAKQMDEMGVGTIIYTDTSRDGMMIGVNAEAMAEMCDAVSCEVVASGGVTTQEDITILKNLKRDNLAGVIVGKALYEGTVTL